MDDFGFRGIVEPEIFAVADEVAFREEIKDLNPCSLRAIDIDVGIVCAGKELENQSKLTLDTRLRNELGHLCRQPLLHRIDHGL